MSARGPGKLNARVLMAMGGLVLALAALTCSRWGAHRETAMRNEQTNSTRLVTYALKPGDALRIPVAPGTDVIRVVVHAFSLGPLGTGEHRALWAIGTGMPLEVALPGATGRAKAEESGVTIGDPTAFNLDAREHEPELLLRLQSVSAAEGVLVRVYRRETLLAPDEQLRRGAISIAQREHLAVRAGELGWVDLAADDRATLFGSRWQKVAPLPTEGQPFRAIALSLSPVPVPERPSLVEVASTSPGEGDSVAGVVTGPNRLVVRGRDAATRLSLFARSPASGEQRLSGVGQLELAVTPASVLDFRATSEAGAGLTVLVTETRGTRLATPIEFDRVAPGRPAVVQALGASVVLRVQARRPLPQGDLQSAPLRLSVDVADDGHIVSSPVNQLVRPAAADRYEADPVGRVPSEAATFFVLLPARGRVTVQAFEEVDLSLAELDPHADGQRFVSRRPSNWLSFGADAHGTLHEAHRLPSVSAHEPEPSSVQRVARPRVARVIKVAGRSYVPSSTRIPFEVHAGAPSRFLLRLLPEQATNVRVLIDGAEPRRRVSGLATSITTRRTVRVDGETKLSLVLGDDLQVGQHVLSFESLGASCVVHVPWLKRTSSPLETAWVVGDFEP